jgi:hypothetical protein
LRTIVILAGIGVVVAGCADEKVDPLAVTNTATLTDIRDNTGSEYYSVNTASLRTTGVGTTLTLGFAITNFNHHGVQPRLDHHLRGWHRPHLPVRGAGQVPHLERTTDTWDFTAT